MSKIKYTNLFYLLLAFIPLVLLISWKLSFSQSLESYRELRQLKESVRLYPNPDQTLMQLQNELGKIRDNGPADHQTIDDQLMEAISDNLGRFNIQLEEFPETHSYQGKNYMVQTFRIRLSGSFVNLLRFLHHAEYEVGSCSIISLAFQREVHRKRGERLWLELSFQSLFKNNKDE